jgi:glycosyltransferase involved in cell wall biosynthesis
MGHQDAPVWAEFEARIARHGIADRLCMVDDFDHDQFLTALTRSAMYVRTPPADGVSSSVLESLALRVPVVAAENGGRPAGVVTYRTESSDDLSAAILRVLDDRTRIAEAIPVPQIADTLADEARLLTN